MKKITVISVVRNLVKAGRVDYFKKMVESVQCQTYENIEHIVVDGMSDDGTSDLLIKYQSDGLITYYEQKDDGPYDAVNKAIQKYAGEYVVLLHSDDYLFDKNAIEMQMKYLEMTDSDYVTGNTIFIDNRNNQVFPYPGIANNYDTDFYFLKGDNTPVFWIETSYNHEGMLFKKSVFETVGYFSDEKYYGTSTDFKFEFDLILKDLKHVHIPYNFLCFRIGGASSSPDLRFYNILKYMYSKFYFREVSDITEYDRLRQKPDKLFVFGLKNWLLSLKLKNFDYEKCFDFLNIMIEKQKNINNIENKSSYQNNNPFFRESNLFSVSFLGFPLMKIKTDTNGNKHFKLFFLFPILKIKHDSKGGKTYKLFSFLPVLKIRKK